MSWSQGFPSAPGGQLQHSGSVPASHAPCCAPGAARDTARGPRCPDGAACAPGDARPRALTRRLARGREACVVVGAGLRQSTAFLVAERALVLARRGFLGCVAGGCVGGRSARTAADVGSRAILARPAVPAPPAPLAALAAIAKEAPAVDVGFLAVMPVIGALVTDTHVGYGVARVRSTVGVLLAWLPLGAEGAESLAGTSHSRGCQPCTWSRGPRRCSRYRR